MSSDERRSVRRPRPITRVDLPLGPAKDLNDAIYDLYLAADTPRLDEIVASVAELADELDLPGKPGRDTVDRIIGGDGVRTQQDTVSVAVVLAHAAGRDPAVVADGVRGLWRAAKAFSPKPAASGRGADGSVRSAYLARLRDRYRLVDLAILLPASDQVEHPPVGLREVFIAPAVRADPPPVELPREVWQRLTESGELNPDDLPEGVDPRVVAQVHDRYRQRPAVPVWQVLAREQRMVLLGDPGAGKSTLSRYLMLALADETQSGPVEALAGWLPLLVELRTYADAQWRSGTFLDLVDHLHRTEGLGLPKTMLEEVLTGEGRVVVVFDGLDEVFDPQVRDTVARRIGGFAAAYPRVRVVVTSRVVGYKRQVLDAAGFGHHMIQDLDRGQVEAFVTGWYAVACPDNPGDAGRLRRRLIGAVDASAAVRELAGNPMLLTILAIIGRGRELPRDRREVYQHAVAVLVDQWDPGKFLRDTRVDQGMPYIGREDKLELLRAVARRMQDAPAGLAEITSPARN
jgi:hypothetical protein